MREEVRRRIINDLIVTPFVLGPIVLGTTALMLGWAIGAGTLAGMGFGAILAGLGVLGTKFVWNIDSIAKNATQKVIEQKETEKNDKLDLLEQNLVKDRDPIPETCLRQLRLLRTDLKEQSKNNPLATQILDNFEQMFDTCVAKIEETDKLWLKARSLTGTLKKNAVQQRAVLVAEIEAITQKITNSVKDFQDSAVKTQSTTSKELESQAAELAQILEIARRTGERMSNIDTVQKSYDPKEFQ